MGCSIKCSWGKLDINGGKRQRLQLSQWIRAWQAGATVMLVWWYMSVPLTCQIIKHPDAVHMTERHHSTLIDYPTLSTSCHTQSHATTHFSLLPSSNRSDQSKHTCADGGGDEEITVESTDSPLRHTVAVPTGCASNLGAIHLRTHRSSSTTSDVIF